MRQLKIFSKTKFKLGITILMTSLTVSVSCLTSSFKSIKNFLSNESVASELLDHNQDDLNVTVKVRNKSQYDNVINRVNSTDLLDFSEISKARIGHAFNVDNPDWPWYFLYKNGIDYTFLDCDKLPYNYTLLKGVMPEKISDILITDFHLALFKEYGFVDFKSDERSVIKSADDIIGKKLYLSAFLNADVIPTTICGVIDTGFKVENYDGIFEYLEKQGIPVDDNFQNLIHSSKNLIYSNRDMKKFKDDNSLYSEYATFEREVGDSIVRLSLNSQEYDWPLKMKKFNEGEYNDIYLLDGRTELKDDEIAVPLTIYKNFIPREDCIKEYEFTIPKEVFFEETHEDKKILTDVYSFLNSFDYYVNDYLKKKFGPNYFHMNADIKKIKTDLEGLIMDKNYDSHRDVFEKIFNLNIYNIIDDEPYKVKLKESKKLKFAGLNFIGDYFSASNKFIDDHYINGDGNLFLRTNIQPDTSVSDLAKMLDILDGFEFEIDNIIYKEMVRINSDIPTIRYIILTTIAGVLGTLSTLFWLLLINESVMVQQEEIFDKLPKKERPIFLIKALVIPGVISIALGMILSFAFTPLLSFILESNYGLSDVCNINYIQVLTAPVVVFLIVFVGSIHDLYRMDFFKSRKKKEDEY